MHVEPWPLLKVNAPELFSNAMFMAWLNKAITNNEVATWHSDYSPASEYSDVFLTVCTKGQDKEKGFWGEGSNSDMPRLCWEVLCTAIGPDFEGLVWLTNLEE